MRTEHVLTLVGLLVVCSGAGAQLSKTKKSVPTRCARVYCQTTLCDSAFIPLGDCCPICPPAIPNPLVPKPSNNNGPSACASVYCAPVSCQNAYTPNGECCPQCPPKVTCLYKNVNYNHEDQFDEDCNLCRCWNGTVSCTSNTCDRCSSVKCKPVSCRNAFTPSGQCCPVCPQQPKQKCRAATGQIVKHGETVRVECNTCRCIDGNLACTKKACSLHPCALVRCGPPLGCKDSYVPPGKCCPVCKAPKTCKDKQGNVIKHGDTFKDGCKECTCWNGDVSCTSKGCDPCASKVCAVLICPDSYTPPGECCPVCPPVKYCKDPQGKVLKHKDSFNVDCNTCICWNGDVKCTSNKCDPCASKVCEPLICSDSYTPPGECCPVCPSVKFCKDPQGKIIKHKESFSVDCNTCICWKGDISCTKKVCDSCANKVCPPINCPDSYLPAGECCKVCPPPKNCIGPLGKVIKHGENFKDDCNDCTCWNGDIKCTNNACDPCANKVCPPINCPDSYLPAGECCKVCPPPKNCIGPLGKVIKHGENFKDDCNDCTCWNGDIKCTNIVCDPCANKVCPPINCPDSYLPAGECCKVCPPPKNCIGPLGKVIKHGENFKDDCNDCTCWNGDIKCTNIVCDPCAGKVCPLVSCPDSYVPFGECCPVCPPPKDCKDPQGNVVKHGDSYKNDCNVCTCWNGDISCTNKNCDPCFGVVCPLIICLKSITPPGACCPICVDPCKDKVCPVLNCPDSYTPAGECCPVCPPPKNCKDPLGNVVKHGDSYKNDCNDCTCWNGEISCTNKNCDPCAGVVCPMIMCTFKAVTLPGDCCPTCVEPKNCKDPLGNVVKHGDSYKNDCNDCTCWNGDITCTNKVCDPCAGVVCPMIMCAFKAVTLPGACCPSCVEPKNCKDPLGNVLKHGDSYKKECNDCTCWNGDITCTNKNCDPCAGVVCPLIQCLNSFTPPGACCPICIDPCKDIICPLLNCPDSYTPAGECCAICPPPKDCTDPLGNVVKHGDSYKKDCNVCTCWNGEISCTNKNCDPCAGVVCPVNNCLKSFTPPGACCPICIAPKDCKDLQGNVCKHGDSYKDDCNDCSCWDGDVSCTNNICDPCAGVVCPIIQCLNSFTPPGACCPICKAPKNCKDPLGNVVKHGDSYKKDCNDCTCWNGDITCTNKNCAPKDCKDPLGNVVKHGESYKKDCNDCTCWNGEISCTNKNCDPCAGVVCPIIQCLNSFTPPGACCPICKAPKNCKDPLGNVVKHGDSYKKDCNDCTCWNGEISCTNKNCDPCAGVFCQLKICQKWHIPPGECCPVCVDPCQGKVCPPLNCADAYTPAGECCPVCPPPKNCKDLLGNIIKHGESYKKDCNDCTCWNGDISCTNKNCDPCANKVCPFIGCVNSYTPPGSCCPICAPPKKCKKPTGELMSHGDSYSVDCNKCTCWNGDISCTDKICDPCVTALCPVMNCQDAYIPPGECCAICPAPKNCKDPNGNLIKHGDTFNLNCNQCICLNGVITCTDKICDPCNGVICVQVTCSGAYRQPGECCDVCPSLPPTKKVVDRCASVKCLPAPCRNTYIPKGKCCPRCRKHARKVGRCHATRCRPTPCPDPYTPEGKCCPECPATTPAPLDPCHGVTCPPVKCTSPVVPLGQCCAICPPATPAPSNLTKACVVKGVTYNTGEEVPSSDPCNVCACLAGNVNCITMSCAMPLCNNAYVPAGQCCPQCPPIDPLPLVFDVSLPDLFPKNCQVNSYVYSDGDSVPADDVCKSCECLQGNITCQTKTCSPLNCDDSYTPAGDCCPKCPDNSGN